MQRVVASCNEWLLIAMSGCEQRVWLRGLSKKRYLYIMSPALSELDFFSRLLLVQRSRPRSGPENL